HRRLPGAPPSPYTTLFRSGSGPARPSPGSDHGPAVGWQDNGAAGIGERAGAGRHGRALPRPVSSRRQLPGDLVVVRVQDDDEGSDRKSTRLNSSHVKSSYA